MGAGIISFKINGQPLTINWANRYVAAILEAWFPNQYGSKVIAETLFGNYNPGGKLSITFPKTTGRLNLIFFLCPVHSQTREEGISAMGIQGSTVLYSLLARA
jgi:beta-glucosidase